jgi:hypothetical protein
MTLRIPVKLVDGHWELLYGGGIPVKDGSVAELRLEKYSISDKSFLATVSAKRSIKILEEGTQLLFALTPDLSLPEVLASHFLNPLSVKYEHVAKISTHARFIRVHLSQPTDAQKRLQLDQGGLWLKLEGLVDRGVESSSIKLPPVPGLKKQVASSLNHAFTLLSEVFETQRISHTGNIYESVFYQDSDETWFPLKDLRNRELAKAERKVIKDLWQQVIQKNSADLFNGF